jgi:hypothetical protein
MDGLYVKGMMHEGMEDAMACPCSDPANVYPCHDQTPPMMSLGYARQCRAYPEVSETEPLKISGATRSGG